MCGGVTISRQAKESREPENHQKRNNPDDGRQSVICGAEDFHGKIDQDHGDGKSSIADQPEAEFMKIVKKSAATTKPSHHEDDRDGNHKNC